MKNLNRSRDHLLSMHPFLWSLAWSAIISGFFACIELIPYWRSRGQHWTERARARHTARVFGVINPWLTPVAVTLAHVAFVSKSSWPAALAGSFLGALLGDYVLARGQHPSLTLLRWAHLAAAGLVLRVARYGVLFAAVVLMPRNFGWGTALDTSLYLMLHFGLQLGGGAYLLRWLGLLVPPRPRLTALVAELSLKCGVSPRATWEIVSLEANACALVATRELAFSQPLVDALPDDEVRAVAAHELAHLAEGRPILLSRLAGTLTLAPFLFLKPLSASFNIGGLVFCSVAALTLHKLNKSLGLKMEKRADAATVAVTQDGATYARALEHLHQLNEVVAVQQDSAAQTHPNLYDRMVAAGVTPDYPRPLPPSSWSWSSFLLMMGLAISGISLLA